MGNKYSKNKDLEFETTNNGNEKQPKKKVKGRSKSFSVKSRSNGTNGNGVNGDSHQNQEQPEDQENVKPEESTEEQNCNNKEQSQDEHCKDKKSKDKNCKDKNCKDKNCKEKNSKSHSKSFWSKGNKKGTSLTNIDRPDKNEALKETKIKSKSSAKLGSMSRSQSLKRTTSNKTLGNSVVNLRRVNSLRHILSRDKRKKKKKAKEEEASECHFEKLYPDQLHLLIFRYLSLKEKVQIRAVCEKWDRDLFAVQTRMRFPLFVTPPNEPNDGRALFLSKKYLYFSENIRSIYITQSLTRELFFNLIKYLPTKRLEEIEFCINVKDKSEIIPHYLLVKFSETFGPRMKRLKLMMAKPNEPATSKDRNNNVLCDNISGVILQMLCLCSESYSNLVHLELTITNRLIQKYLSHLWDYKYQLKTLSIKLCFDIVDFVQLATESVKFVSSFKRLQTLDLAICPMVNSHPVMIDGQADLRPRPSRITNLSLLTGEIGQLSKLMLDCTVRQLSLSINISHIDCTQLDLITPLAAFTNLRSLSLKIYDNRKFPPTDLLPRFDFSKLSAIINLNSLTVSYSNLIAANIEQLIACCPKLTELNLSCDVRLNSVAVNTIVRNQIPLESFSICGLESTVPVIEEEEEEDADNEPDEIPVDSLTTDTEALGKLLKISSLRVIRMENCRVDIENCSVLFNLRQFTSFRQREMFEISIVKNQIPLILPSKFYQKYDEYIPPNLKFYLN